MNLIIDKTGLRARLAMEPMRKETGGFLVPSLSEIGVWLKEKGILAPMEAASLEAGLERLAQGMGAEPVAALGVEPVPGEDGYLEVLVELEPSFLPTGSGRGSVDMRASLIHNVEPGQPLAVIHPPTAGRPGLDVYGRMVAARPGEPLNPRLGRNTRRSQHDPNLIVSASSGHARLVDGAVDVQEFYLVDGDVDYGTGNVAFGKSVLVMGDVKAGFSVEAGGDLEVTGLVEDCLVRAQGKVVVRGGFTGQGKGLVSGRGSVLLGHVRNQQVRCEGDIRIAREAVNGRLQSGQSISVSGLLAGGRAQARRAIECQVAGTETGTPTHLEVGFDYTVVEEMGEIRLEMDKLGKYARKIEDSLLHIHDIEKLNRSLDSRTIGLLFELEEMRSKVDAKVRSLREKHSEMERSASQPETAVITVQRTAFPGVVVKIGKELHLVDEVLAGPRTFYLLDGAIRIR